MNYRHAFHAGNFADLVKHATLTVLLEALQRDAAPLQVLDTHAGAGAYDLSGGMAGKTREADAGIVRLMDDGNAPPAFDALEAAVRRLNPEGGVRYYPGSPLLIAERLRPDDGYIGCELRPDDHAALTQTLGAFPNAEARLGDGYAEAANQFRRGLRSLVVIDPPFERSDDYENILGAVAAARALDAGVHFAIWLPLKDLETFDAFLRGLEDRSPGGFLVAEARLKPLHEPLKMNGCAMVLIDPPAGVEAPLRAICGWVAETLGNNGALGRVAAFGM